MPSWFSRWTKSPPLAPEIVAEEFIAFVRREMPEVALVQVGENALKISGAHIAEQTLLLDKLQHECAEIPGQKNAQREEVYRRWLTLMNGESVAEALKDAPFADIQGRVYPKIVQEGFFDLLRAHNTENVHESRDSVPGHLIANTPYHLIYVIDFPDRVAYILGEQMKSYEIDEQQLSDVAFANARRLLSYEEGRDLFESDEVKTVACEEGHPTARLLILPEYLESNEEFAVVIPSQDLLMLTDVPADNNWNPLRQFARQSDGLPQPLRVSQNGLTAM